MNADEAVRREPRLKVAQRVAHEMRLARGVHRDVVAGRIDPVDLAWIEHVHEAVGAHEDALARVGPRALMCERGDERAELAAPSADLVLREAAASTLDALA